MAQKDKNEIKDKSHHGRKRKQSLHDDEKKTPKNMLGMREGTMRGVLTVVLFMVCIFFILAALGSAGMAGRWVYTKLNYLLGVGYFLLPAVAFLFGISTMRSMEQSVSSIKAIGATLFFLSGLGIIGLFSMNNGGVVGTFINQPLIAFFDVYASGLFLLGLLAISVILLFDAQIITETSRALTNIPRALYNSFTSLMRTSSPQRPVDTAGDPVVHTSGEDLGSAVDEQEKNRAQERPVNQVPTSAGGTGGENKNESGEAVGGFFSQRGVPGQEWSPPPLSLLERDRGKPSVGDIKANTNTIKRTLQNFGVTVEMAEVSIGPTVTRYALKPAEGVKLARIVALTNDLALALAAHPIRIEAPIPGKSLVGIEIPNTIKSTVGLASLLSADEYQRSTKPLTIALGKSIVGKPQFGDLAKMPHLLIAGATGSGKSVTIHSVITSLLFRNPPEQLGFVMIDPKRVELTLYNSIPHLLTPVITSAQQAIKALKGAASEMERRYVIFQEHKVRDINSYQTNVLAPAYAAQEAKQKKKGAVAESDNSALPPPMPYIVIIIDELADIMTAYPRELESAIVRLAQMSRATGIHLILSTQRPSVNVITGLIKANVPGRIALRVASHIDSRTILDSMGAESLLGSGDMLYLAGEMSKPQRLQSAFISEAEVKRVVGYLAEQYDNITTNDLPIGEAPGAAGLGPGPVFAAALNAEEEDSEKDELYDQAQEEVLRAGKASTSLLQRRLGIGYGRAARIIDMLEARGVVGPADGSKPRQVLAAENSAGFGEMPPSEELA